MESLLSCLLCVCSLLFARSSSIASSGRLKWFLLQEARVESARVYAGDLNRASIVVPQKTLSLHAVAKPHAYKR